MKSDKKRKTMNLLILAAYGQIARIVEDRILSEPEFKNVTLTLGLRKSDRLRRLGANPRVTVAEVDLENRRDIDAVMKGQDLVFVDVVDHDPDNAMTRNVIASMKANKVGRVIFANVAGIYDEVPGAFGRWNAEMVGRGLPTAAASDRLLKESGLDYTTLRLCWLTNRDEVRYVTTKRDETFKGVSGSRKSAADLILRIVKDPAIGANDSLGIADPTTEGSDRPVY